MAEHFVGVISDTHGLLRPQAVEVLRGAELIVHAGDVGKPEVLVALGAIAPVVAVRGNADRGEWSWALPLSAVAQAGGQFLYILHEIGELNLDPAAGGFAAVIYGHSHQPSVDMRGGVLFLNPGSAGPRRFRLPVSMAQLWVRDGAVEPRLVELEPGRRAGA